MRKYSAVMEDCHQISSLWSGFGELCSQSVTQIKIVLVTFCGLTLMRVFLAGV